MACETCKGRGELRNTDGTRFACPDCGGTASDRGSGPARGGRNAGKGKGQGGESFNVPARTWALVIEATKLNGRQPREWALEALASAARGQIHKHARSGKGGRSGDAPSTRPGEVP